MPYSAHTFLLQDKLTSLNICLIVGSSLFLPPRGATGNKSARLLSVCLAYRI